MTFDVSVLVGRERSHLMKCSVEARLVTFGYHGAGIRFLHKSFHETSFTHSLAHTNEKSNRSFGFLLSNPCIKILTLEDIVIGKLGLELLMLLNT